MARPQNGISKQDAYREKQKNLDSQVLHKTDYQQYAPESRRKVTSF